MKAKVVRVWSGWDFFGVKVARVRQIVHGHCVRTVPIVYEGYRTTQTFEMSLRDPIEWCIWVRTLCVFLVLEQVW